MIKCENLCVDLGKARIVDGFTADFEDGLVTAIIGKNGSGKTTLLKAISGLYRYSGSVLLDGKESQRLKPAQRAKLVSLMPQVLPQPPVSVKKLVSFGRSPYTGMSGILSPADIHAVDTAIKYADIERIAHRRLNQISGGEQRKAFFAMLMTQSSKNVLLDEPCANLDAGYMGRIISIINSLKADNKAVAIVIHDINLALELSDRIICLDKGKCIFCGTPSQAVSQHIPQEVFSLKPYYCTDENGNQSVFYKQI